MGTTNFNGNLLLLGGGNDNPRLFGGSLAEGQPVKLTPLTDFSDRGTGLSLYALAQSAGQRLVAVATKPGLDHAGRCVFPSYVRVFPLASGSDPLGLGPQAFELIFPAGVYGLDISDDGLLLLACGDGVLRGYSITAGATPQFEVQGHQGYACAVAWIKPGKSLASYGQDGFLRVYDYLSRRVEHSSSFCPPASHAALASLAVDSQNQCVYYGCAAGHLHAFDASSGEELKVDAHPGGVLAVAWHPLAERVISGGFADGRIAVWQPGDLCPVGDVGHGGAIFGFVPLADQRLAVVDAQSVSLYRLGASFELVGNVSNVSCRSWSGPDLQIIAESQRDATTQQLERLRSEGRNLARAGEEPRLLEIVSELTALGYGLDALLLHAQLCRQQGKGLQEYRIWQDIRRQNGDRLPHPAGTYLYAELLERLLEIVPARELYQSLGDYRDAAQRAARLQNHPFCQADAGSAVRFDFTAPEQVLEELEKCTLLKTDFPWAVRVQSMKMTPLSCVPALDDLIQRIEANYDASLGRWELLQENRWLLSPQTLQSHSVLVVRLADPRPVVGCLELVLQTEETPAGCQVQLHVLFAPGRARNFAPAGQTWNEAVADWWQEAWFGDAGHQWIDLAYSQLNNAIKQYVNLHGSPDDSGF